MAALLQAATSGALSGALGNAAPMAAPNSASRSASGLVPLAVAMAASVNSGRMLGADAVSAAATGAILARWWLLLLKPRRLPAAPLRDTRFPAAPILNITAREALAISVPVARARTKVGAI